MLAGREHNETVDGVDRVTEATGPVLVAVCGYPGVGKSTVAETLTGWLDATRLRTDAVRKELYDEPTYTSAESKIVYETVLSRARDHLEDGPVVVDASFADRRYRAQAERVARERGVPFRLVKVHCEQSVALGRIREREGISDADVEIYHHVKESFDPLGADRATVDNSGAWDQTVEQLRALSLRE